MLACYSHILLFSAAMNDVFLLFPIKYRRHGSVDTMKGLDCSLLERIQLLGCSLCNGSLLIAELHGIMDGSDREKQSVYWQNAFYYVITINNALSLQIYFYSLLMLKYSNRRN